MGCGKATPLFCLIFLLSLKLECEKLASEKTEMQRHYVMVRVLPMLPTSMLSLNRASWDVLHCFYGCFPLPTLPVWGTACLSHLSEPNRDPSCEFPVWVPTGLRAFTPLPWLHPISVPRVAPAVHTGCLLCSTTRCRTDSTLRCINR